MLCRRYVALGVSVSTLGLWLVSGCTANTPGLDGLFSQFGVKPSATPQSVVSHAADGSPVPSPTPTQQAGPSPTPTPSPTPSPIPSPSPTPSPTPTPAPTHTVGEALTLDQYPWAGKSWAGRYSDGSQRYVFVYPMLGAKWYMPTVARMPIKGQIYLAGTTADDFYFESDEESAVSYFPYNSQPAISGKVRFWRTYSWNTVGYGFIRLARQSNGTWDFEGSLGSATFFATQGNINPNPETGVK